MHRIDTDTAEEDTHGAGKDGFTGGDPQAAIAPTDLSADWCNAVQEEIANVVEAAGISLDKGDNEQLRKATLDRILLALDRLGGQDGSGEWLYRDGNGDPAPKARTVVPHLLDAHPLEEGEWARHEAGGTHLFEMESQADGAFLYVPLRLPVGAVLTQADAMVQPGAARSGTSRMDLRWAYREMSGSIPDHTTAPTSSGNFAKDDGTTDAQVLSITPNLTIEAGREYYLRVQAGNDAGTNTDVVRGFEIQFDDPGPRNY
ncbi:MAG: hypothetical protein ACODAG_04310 [Myxococcota bacterium]